MGSASTTGDHKVAAAGSRAILSCGTAGSVAMAVASWRVGALPKHWHVGVPTQAVFYALYYAGLAALVGAWLVLARRVADQPPDAARAVQWFTAVSAAPLLAAAPFGRDLWAYAAQGHVVAAGLDPYRHGPADVPGAFAAEVSARWAHTASPYGPVWLQVSHAAAWISHGHPLAAAILLRLPAYAGVLLCCWAVPRLAARLRGNVAPALWLGVANPLMIVLGVGGGHNDLLMLGLALVGLAVAAGPRLAHLVAGAAIAAVAVLVKSPAAVAVAFTVPMWLAGGRRALSARTVTTACAAVLGAGAAAAAIVTAATGLGSGWVSQTNASAVWVSWLSLPSAVAMGGKFVAGIEPVGDVDSVMRACRTAGEIVLVVVVAALWVSALRARRGVTGRPPTDQLAAAWLAAAALAPAVQPWYYLWGLAVLAIGARSRGVVFAATVVAVAFTVMITPPGNGWESDPRVFGVFALAVALCALQPRRVWRMCATGPGPAFRARARTG